MFFAVAVTIDSIMKPVFGTPTGTGVLPTGGIATQTPMREDIRECRVALVLVDEDEAARDWSGLSMPLHGADAAEGRQHHREGERQFVRRLATEPSSCDLLDVHHAGLDLRRPWRW